MDYTEKVITYLYLKIIHHIYLCRNLEHIYNISQRNIVDRHLENLDITI